MKLGFTVLAKDRYTSLQTILGNCYQWGCLFLCLCSIAEEQSGKHVDLIDAIKVSQAKGWLSASFDVNDNLSILEYLTGKKWSRNTVNSLPHSISTNEYTVAIYYNKRTGFKHFRRRGYDTLESSVTVKEGTLIGYYIYSWSYS